MNLSTYDDEVPAQRPPRLRFELIFASILLAFGLFALPALIFWVGAALLGPYGEGSGLGRFYSDFFGDLAEPSVRAWTLAMGPLLLVSLMRAVFVGVRPADRRETDQEPAPRPNSRRDGRLDSRSDAQPRSRREPPPTQTAKAAPRSTRRVEPRIGLD